MPEIDIPFYCNTDDDTHCFQAVMKMLLKHFFPEREYLFDELDRLTGKRGKNSTWPAKGLMYLKGIGLEVLNIDPFDYREFIRDGKDYLVETYGEPDGLALAKRSNIRQEQEAAQEYINAGIQKKRVPLLGDITELIDDGWLVGCFVNAKTLYNRGGFSEHIVVVYGYDGESLHLHDPGLPPRPCERISFDQFLKGWEANQSLIAVRGSATPLV